MNITRENIDNVNAVINIAIEKADYEKQVAEVLKDYRQKASIPGFRPGMTGSPMMTGCRSINS